MIQTDPNNKCCGKRFGFCDLFFGEWILHFGIFFTSCDLVLAVGS